ncbi:MAG: glycosyltransferase [Ilumatobacteraceae bacterium]|nr:glycosyltransferase [Ilumatobacteraceae bacterium]
MVAHGAQRGPDGGRGRASVKTPAMILGIPIDRVTMDEAVTEIERLVQLGRRRSTTHQVVTVNVDFVVNAVGDDDLMRILQFADLDLADGMPLVWAAGRIGEPIAERVTGADLVPALAERSARTGLHIHLFGSADGIAERACALLIERHPGARITADSGPMITDPRSPGDDVVERLAAVDADVVCVALGNPKQEHFIAAIRAHLGAPVMIGVGGTLDMLVGVRKRAPAWMQKFGLEWIFRALQEPRRLGKRYAKDIFVFGPRLLMFLVRARTVARRAVPGRIPGLSGTHEVVDLAGVECLALDDLGVLAARRRTTRQDGGSLLVEHVGEWLRAQLRSCGLDDLLTAGATSTPQ